MLAGWRAVELRPPWRSDLLQLLGLHSGLMQWFQFRTDVLTRNLNRVRTYIHQAAGPQNDFGADTYPSSLAMFGRPRPNALGGVFDLPAFDLTCRIFVMKTWAAWAASCNRC